MTDSRLDVKGSFSFFIRFIRWHFRKLQTYPGTWHSRYEAGVYPGESGYLPGNKKAPIN